MLKSTQEHIRDGMEKYREIGWEGSIEELNECLLTGRWPARGDPLWYCFVSALSNYMGHEPGSPERAMLDALDKPDGLSDENFYNGLPREALI
jgi:hypothetical protein